MGSPRLFMSASSVRGAFRPFAGGWSQRVSFQNDVVDEAGAPCPRGGEQIDAAVELRELDVFGLQARLRAKNGTRRFERVGAAALSLLAGTKGLRESRGGLALLGREIGVPGTDG